MNKYLLVICMVCSGLISCHSQESKPAAATQKSYQDFLIEIDAQRNQFKVLYTKSDSIRKDSLVKAARKYLFNTITSEIFNYWYGTPWDFYGQTRTPKEGKIACGYFVTGILTDVGFDIPRVEWAKCASETFIKRLGTSIKRFINKPITEVETYINQKGDGLYIVGLDNHVGFIYKNADSIRFVHSNGWQPDIGVMSESIDSDNPLNVSHYRVIVKLFESKQIVKWILNLKFE